MLPPGGGHRHCSHSLPPALAPSPPNLTTVPRPSSAWACFLQPRQPEVDEVGLIRVLSAFLLWGPLPSLGSGGLWTPGGISVLDPVPTPLCGPV